jgi:hypothetical protein
VKPGLLCHLQALGEAVTPLHYPARLPVRNGCRAVAFGPGGLWAPPGTHLQQADWELGVRLRSNPQPVWGGGKDGGTFSMHAIQPQSVRRARDPVKLCLPDWGPWNMKTRGGVVVREECDITAAAAADGA